MPPHSSTPDSHANSAAATVAVQHHVYSSAGGYRTLMAHPVAQAHLSLLEEFARGQCTSPNTQTLWASLPLNETHWLISKTFNAGVDRAGRPRKCVHTIIVERARLAERWPGFNPLRMPAGWFLTKKSNLEEQALPKQLATSLAPPESQRTRNEANNPIESERELALVRVLMHAERGLVALHAETTEHVSAIFDWLPLPYRLRWAVSTDPISQPSHERQVILSGSAPKEGALPLLAKGKPIEVQQLTFGVNGVWDIWLVHLGGTTSKTFETFRRWFDHLPLHTAPSAAEEHWLLAAFQCLSPFEPVANVAPKLQSGHMGQIALGILAMGWANQAAAAVDRLAEYGDGLIAHGNVPALVQLLTSVLSATTPSLESLAQTTEDGSGEPSSRVSSMQAQLAEEEQLYSPHAAIAQTVFRLLLSSSRLSLTPAIAADVPTPDVRASANPWSGERRSLLWANLYLLLRDLLTRTQDADGATWLGNDAYRSYWLQLASFLGTLRQYEAAFARDHHWILNELAAPTGPPQQLASLYDKLEQQHHVPAKDLAAARRHLATFR